MKKDLLFKTIALGAMVVGGVSLATAAVTRFRRMKDERDAADAIVEAEVIKENFSGASGLWHGDNCRCRDGSYNGRYNSNTGFCEGCPSKEVNSVKF